MNENKNVVTGIACINRPEGTRLSANYCILDEDGKVISDNNRINRVIMDDDLLEAFRKLHDYAQSVVDSEPIE